MVKKVVNSTGFWLVSAAIFAVGCTFLQKHPFTVTNNGTNTVIVIQDSAGKTNKVGTNATSP